LAEPDPGGLFLVEDAGQLLLGGLSLLCPLRIVERPGLGERRLGAGQLHLQFLHSPPATEQRHRASHEVMSSEAAIRGAPLP
jgi:hypothetical protein